MLRATRLTVVHGVLLAFAAALIARSAFLQVWQRQKWGTLAARQHFARTTLGAPRGEILDVSGLSLAQSEVKVRLAIAPAEVKEPRRLLRALQRVGVDQSTLQRVTDRRRKWVPIGKSFFATDVASLQSMTGVHAETVGERAYVPSEGLRRIVGRVNDEGDGVDGIEMMLDSLLHGERGTSAPSVNAKGERYESPDMLTEPPRPGHSVVLTISYVLQDICDRALADATQRFDASGGDIVVLDPRSGEIRCLASRRSDAVATGTTAFTEPFEPGSTLKPFYAGFMIDAKKARPDEVIETFNGTYTTHGRTITDVHKAPRLSLADVIRYSSNIGIVRFTERLSAAEMYETLRDFGFGTPTGVPYPSEASGVLREPRRWSGQSQASVAIGYEITVTPLQLATAYASIANGGSLLAPALVKEIRDPDGNALYVHRPALVRRVLQPRTTEVLRRILASVVDSGTATDASLSSYALGGKSGTARRASGGVYGAGSYTSTFVGLFPAADPQYVVLVKLDNPRGTYYGGKAAAPVAKAVIEAAIAARDAALDRSDLEMQKARYVPPSMGDDALSPAATASASRGRARGDERPAAGVRGSGPGFRYALVDSTPEPPAARPVRIDLNRPTPPALPAAPVVVPDVHDLPLRVAVRELHRAGLHVNVISGASGMVPPAGSTVASGSLVKLGRQ
jgi:cell division protein FtsI (penicillin-binding protein 3)